MSPFIRRIERRSWILWGILVVVSSILARWDFVLGVGLGGVLSVLGFRVLKGVVSRVLALPSHRARGRMVAYHYGWMALVFAILALALSSKLVDPLGLLLGLSVVMMNLLLSTILDLRRIHLEV